MYKSDAQISLMEFKSPLGRLDPENRWVKMADMIPWSKYEPEYKKQFCKDNGAPAIKFRMALGTLLIKQQTGHSDDEALQDILENPYMQFLIGLHGFTTVAPFSSSSITNFRKYIPAGMINAINEELFRENVKSDEGPPKSGGGGPGSGSPKSDVQKSGPRTEAKGNKGALMLDATCAPADIAYPTDVNLLNGAREKLEGIIDALHPKGYAKPKPRTYRRKARKQYLSFVKQKKPGQDKVRKAIGQQLRFVLRNLRHVDEMLGKFGPDKLGNNQRQWLETIRQLYEQQQYMYKERTHSVSNRIVSIGQPHVRPIVRGNARAPVEFGAKASISLVDGYAFPDIVKWDNYNEASQLITAIEAYKKHNGCCPERVLADTLYLNKDNRAYCKKHGIRLSGPPLGRPPKIVDKALLKQQSRDAADRGPVEGKFGEGKSKYGLGRIMARLKESSGTVISMAFFSMNINRRLRVLLFFFQNMPKLARKWFLLELIGQCPGFSYLFG